MKVLFINDQFERGGAGRVAAIQCNGLKRKGFDIILVSDSKHWKETYSIDKNIERREITVKTQSRGKIAKICKWLKCSYDIRTYIKKENPDVIIAVQSMMFLCSYLASIGLKVPIIAADHTSFDRKIDPIIDFVRYHLYRKADGLSILTQKDKRLIGNRFPQSVVIYNPLSFPVLNTTTPRVKRVLCAGRLEDWKVKGFDCMIKMWSELVGTHPEWKLEIAGNGTESSVLYIKELIDEYGVSNSVKLLGQVNKMKELYASSAIFALPSRMEGFPMVLMEAMSQGCTCVAFSIRGASDEMLGADSGFIIPDGDYDKFKEALNNVMNNEEIREEYSPKAICAVSKFSTEAFICEWEKLIYKTLRLYR